MADQIIDEASRIEKLVETGDTGSVSKALYADSVSMNNKDFGQMLSALQADNKAATTSFGGGMLPTLEITDSNGQTTLTMKDNVMSQLGRAIFAGAAAKSAADVMTGDANRKLGQ